MRRLVRRIRVALYYWAGAVKALIIMLLSSSQRRHAWEWVKSLRRGYLMARPMPWIVYDAYEHIQKTVPQNAAIFEYGSGASTLYWLQEKNARCVSVEHDQGWYQLLTARLAAHHLSNRIDYRMVLPEPSAQAPIDIYDPNSYADEKYAGYSFEQYVKQIDAFPDEYFDVVMVDGRSRPACIIHSLPKLKMGGMLILDNADRDWYFKHTVSQLKPLDVVCFVGAVPGFLRYTQTNIYVKQTPGIRQAASAP